MDFNDHSKVSGQHAFLSASNYHWTNYDDEKLVAAFLNAQAARRGTELHAFAHNAVRLGIKLPNTKRSLNQYVNDAIGFRMSTEQILFYSNNCYGTADAVAFNRNLLRIHDFKSGIVAGNMRQLEVYASLFCLEYGYRPVDIETELRIYQGDEIHVMAGDVDTITHIMSKIIVFDRTIEEEKLKLRG